ncbi:unnamed protein product [Pedinophyceae sp. YPF-701]|nr:unnamed protein product [Pedinophyceae sp. YPF-701]
MVWPDTIRASVQAAVEGQEIALLERAFQCLKEALQGRVGTERPQRDLIIHCAEAAIGLEAQEIASEALHVFDAESSHVEDEDGKALLMQCKDQFWVRSMYARGLLKALSTRRAKGQELVDSTLQAANLIMAGMRQAGTNPRYKFLVYNGSVHFWHCSWPLHRAGLRHHVLAMTKECCALLQSVAGTSEWRAKLLLALARCLAEAEQAEEAVKVLEEARVLLAGVLPPPPPKLEDIAKEMKKKGGDKDKGATNAAVERAAMLAAAEAAAAAAADPAVARAKHLMHEVVATKAHLMIRMGKAKDAVPVDDKTEDVIKAVACLQSVRSSPEMSVEEVEQQLQRAWGYVDAEVDQPPQLANLAVIAAVSWVAAMRGALLLAEETSRRAQSSQEVLVRCRAELSGVLVRLRKLESAKGDKLTEENIKGRCAVLAATDQLCSQFLRMGDPTGVQDCAILVWNASLPLLQHNLHHHVRKPFLAASRALAAIQSPLNRLRAQLHLEVAKLDMEDDAPIKALEQANAGLALDYQADDGEKARTGLERPLDRFLEPIRRSLYLKTTIQEEGGTLEELVIVLVERAKDVKGLSAKQDLLERAINLYRDLDVPVVQYKEGQRATDALLEARQQCGVWLSILHVAWAARLHRPVLLAAPYVLAFRWDPERDWELAAQQAEACYIEAEAGVLALRAEGLSLKTPVQAAAAAAESAGRMARLETMRGIGQGRGAQVRPAALTRDAIWARIPESIAQGMDLAAGANQPWLVINGGIYTWQLYKDAIQERRYNELEPVVGPVFERLMRASDSSPGALNLRLACLLGAVYCSALEHTFLVKKYKESGEREQKRPPSRLPNAKAGDGGDSGATAAAVLPSRRAEAPSHQQLLAMAAQHGWLAENDPGIEAAIIACEKVMSCLGKAAPERVFVEAYCRVRSLAGRPMKMDGVGETAAEKSKGAKQAKGAPAAEDDADDGSVKMMAARVVTAIGILESNEFNRVEKGSALTRGAGALVEMERQQGHSDVEMWAKLARAAQGANMHSEAVQCAKHVTAALLGKKDPQEIDLIEDAPEIKSGHTWYWLSVCQNVLSSSVLGLIEPTQDSIMQARLKRMAINHAVASAKFASFCGRKDLANAAARLLWNASVDFMNMNVTRRTLAIPFSEVSSVLASMGIVDPDFGVKFYLALSDFMNENQRFADGLMYCEEALRILPTDHHWQLLEWKVLFASKLGRDVEGEILRIASYPPETQARVWYTLAVESRSAEDQTRGRKKAAEVLKEKPWMQAEYIMELAEFVLYQENNLDEARQLLNKAVRMVVRSDDSGQLKRMQLLQRPAQLAQPTGGAIGVHGELRRTLAAMTSAVATGAQPHAILDQQLVASVGGPVLDGRPGASIEPSNLESLESAESDLKLSEAMLAGLRSRDNMSNAALPPSTYAPTELGAASQAAARSAAGGAATTAGRFAPGGAMSMIAGAAAGRVAMTVAPSLGQRAATATLAGGSDRGSDDLSRLVVRREPKTALLTVHTLETLLRSQTLLLAAAATFPERALLAQAAQNVATLLLRKMLDGINEGTAQMHELQHEHVPLDQTPDPPYVPFWDDNLSWANFTGLPPYVVDVVRADSREKPEAARAVELARPQLVLTFVSYLIDQLIDLALPQHGLPLCALHHLAGIQGHPSHAVHRSAFLRMHILLDSLGMGSAAEEALTRAGDLSITQEEKAACQDDLQHQAMSGALDAAQGSSKAAASLGFRPRSPPLSKSGSSGSLSTLAERASSSGSASGAGLVRQSSLRSMELQKLEADMRAIERAQGVGDVVRVLEPMTVHDVWLLRVRHLVQRAQYGPAIEILREALAHAEAFGAHYGVAWCHVHAARMEVLANNKNSALEHLRSAIHIGGGLLLWHELSVTAGEALLMDATAPGQNPAQEASEFLESVIGIFSRLRKERPECDWHVARILGDLLLVKASVSEKRIEEGRRSLVPIDCSLHFNTGLQSLQTAVHVYKPSGASPQLVSTLLKFARYLMDGGTVPGRSLDEDPRPRLRQALMAIREAEQAARVLHVAFSPTLQCSTLSPLACSPVTRQLAEVRSLEALVEVEVGTLTRLHAEGDRRTARAKFPRSAASGADDAAIEEWLDTNSSHRRDAGLPNFQKALSMASSAVHLAGHSHPRAHAEALFAQGMALYVLYQRQDAMIMQAELGEARERKREGTSRVAAQMAASGTGVVPPGVSQRMAEADAARQQAMGYLAKSRRNLEASISEAVECRHLELGRRGCEALVDLHKSQGENVEAFSWLLQAQSFRAVQELEGLYRSASSPQALENLKLRQRDALEKNVVCLKQSRYYNKTLSDLRGLSPMAGLLDVSQPVSTALAAAPEDHAILCMYLSVDGRHMYLGLRLPGPEYTCCICHARVDPSSLQDMVANFKHFQRFANDTFVQARNLRQPPAVPMELVIDHFLRPEWDKVMSGLNAVLTPFIAMLLSDLPEEVIDRVREPQSEDEDQSPLEHVSAGVKTAEAAVKSARSGADALAQGKGGRSRSSQEQMQTAEAQAKQADAELHAAQERLEEAEGRKKPVQWEKILADQPLLLLLDPQIGSLPIEQLSLVAGAASVGRDFSMHFLCNRLALAARQAGGSPAPQETKGAKSAPAPPAAGGGTEIDLGKAATFALSALTYIVDLRAEDDPGAFEGRASKDLIAEFSEAYLPNVGKSWEGVMGGGSKVAGEDECLALMESAKALLYLGMGRFAAFVSPRAYSSIDMKGCRLAIMVGGVVNEELDRRQGALDVRKLPWELASESPYETAAILSLRGVTTVVTNMCTAHPDVNVHVLKVLHDMQDRGAGDVGRALRARLHTCPPGAPHSNSNFAIYGCPFLKPDA